MIHAPVRRSPESRPGVAPPAREVAALHGASKRYGELLALDGVDLAIRAGEVVALLGPNGAGKSTAVHLLLGMLRPSAGLARLFGVTPQRRAARVRVGAMLQVSGVPATLRVREHVDLFRSYYPAPLPLGETLAQAGLEEIAERPYGELSGGQRQRLHLALALAGDPELLFLDEPTTGLDVASRRALWARVRGAIDAGRTVVLTTHYLEEADALADRIVLLDRGRVIADGSPAQIKARAAGSRVRAVTSLEPALLRSLEGVRSVRRDGAATVLLVVRPEPVVAEMLARDGRLSGLEVHAASLEDAFLALTGDRGTETGGGPR